MENKRYLKVHVKKDLYEDYFLKHKDKFVSIQEESEYKGTDVDDFYIQIEKTDLMDIELEIVDKYYFCSINLVTSPYFQGYFLSLELKRD